MLYSGVYYLVTLVKSSANCHFVHRRILKKLKLNKIRQVVFVSCTDGNICGMLKKVFYLIEYRKVVL